MLGTIERIIRYQRCNLNTFLTIEGDFNNVICTSQGSIGNHAVKVDFFTICTATGMEKRDIAGHFIINCPALGRPRQTKSGGVSPKISDIEIRNQESY